MADAWQPATEWHALGRAFYRRTLQYELQWALASLDGYMLASNADGSLFVATRDPTKLVVFHSNSHVEPQLQVYTGAGQLLDTIPWDGTRITALGFTWRDELVVVSEDGQARVYALLVPLPTQGAAQGVEATPSTHYTRLSLGKHAEEVGVTHAIVLPTCVFALLRDTSVVQRRFAGVHADYTTDSPWAEISGAPEPVQFAAVPDAAHLTAWTVVHATHTVLVSTDSTLYALDEHGYTALRTEDAPYSALCASPDGKLLALLTPQKTMQVATMDFSRILRTFDLADSVPLDAQDGHVALDDVLHERFGKTGMVGLAWCGENAVAMAWPDRVLLLGPYDAPLELGVRGTPYMHADAHGLQIWHSAAHEYVEKVQEASALALRPGSTHVAAMLVDASREALQNSPHAYEAIRAILADLVPAVETCVQAAAQEWDVHTQRRLLHAALFGKSFLDAYDASLFLRVSRTLRVLNNAREARVGIPTRCAAYEAEGPDMLLYRLAARNMHHTAIKICQYLGIRADNVLRHWARAKIARTKPLLGQDDDGEQLADVIIARFREADTPNYADIALAAWRAGRPKLATILLGHEVRAVDQVPLLLHMQENRLALRRAVECGDSDLIYHVLFRLQRSMARGEFFRIVQLASQEGAPAPDTQHDTVGLKPSAHATYAHLAENLLAIYARVQDKEMLQELYYLDDRRVDSALLCIDEAPQTPARYAERVEALHAAARHFGDDKEHAVDAQLTNDAASLLGLQAIIDTELASMDVAPAHGSLIGLPLLKTIEVCMQHGLVRRAERLKQEYKVSEPMYFAAKVHACIATRDFDALAKAVGKRPVYGYAPLLGALVHAGFLEEACAYAVKGVADKQSRAAIHAFIERCPAEEHRAKLEAAVAAVA
ncbi:Vacuolar protein sorting-associated protein 16 [Malassezia vespertilionis]|uniref:Probable vacuolar protein sorting-associated protein 16 homolog n=1 Tax=Malassezia vespertilionis TaxID=2020962 RepID=A0A2N1JCP6_9BASI|nr:Vacuolar protein sorting-associated protein 16 [Malassezia vespertilionis]PKI84319.1 hypothetical protein MVES_001622 [Malassezia vespertilionis]WFD06378.1 Vacuolar protein sorting-associated protein 16 [Malassezia vespertilionis]